MGLTNLVGQTLGSRYQIQSQIGQGGMASVYKAYDSNLRRSVAIKVIHPHLSNNPEFFRRFEEEAAAVAHLRHSNIVQMYDFNHDEYLFYMVMEFVIGETLQIRLKRYVASGHRVDKQDAISYTADICDAAFYAHQRGMIHRDIKPANIMLDVDGKAILMDFGIARIVGGSQHTAAGAVLGTAMYMSPEQIQGLQTDARTDIYSIGITLFEMLSGKPPFEADSAMTLMMMHVHDPLPDLRGLQPDLPVELVAIVNKTLAKKRDERFQTASELAYALRKLPEQLQKTSITVPPPAKVMPATPEATLIEAAAPMDAGETLIEGLPPSISAKEPLKAAAPVAMQASEEPQYQPTIREQAVQPVQKAAAPASGAIAERRSIEGKKSKVWILVLVVVLIVVIGGGGYFIFTTLSRGGVYSAKPPSTVETVYLMAAESGQTPYLSQTDEELSIPTVQTFDLGVIITSTQEFSTIEPFKVGLVTDVGMITDKSFNQSAWEGLQMAQVEGKADIIQYIETSNIQDYEKNIASFAGTGYHVIVTVGFNLTEATYQAAKRYPEVYFIGIDQALVQDMNHPDWPLPNLVSIVYNEDESGFLVGALAAMMSTSHKIGAVCGTDVITPVWRFGEGYKAGATYADTRNGTNTEVSVIYHNEVGLENAFNDPAWGATTANSLIDQGFDIIFGCGGETGNGALNAAAKRNVYVIGVDTDQYYTLPEAASQLLTSAIKQQTEPIAAIIALARSGKFPSNGSYLGPSGYAPYHELDNKVPENVKIEMEAILRDLNNGLIKTNVPNMKPDLTDPQAFDFSACAQPCDGTNATTVFSEGVTKIYFQWNYQNIPIGSDYTRVWTMDGQEWVRYSCSWPGPETGIDTVTLSESGGLHSGTWQIKITVNGQAILTDQLRVEGNWTYWSPAGTFNTCYGQR